MRSRLTILVLVLAGMALPALGQEHSRHVSPYAGEESRRIKSLSEAEVADLLAGRGAGFAKAAELNGVPGPAHILEMGEAIGVTADQEQAVREVHARMEAEAKALGARLVALEAELNDAFAAGGITADGLRSMLAGLSAVRGELRYVHLAAHLDAAAILTAAQVGAYNRLRGYAADPCAAVPEGHDAALWRRHNGCPG
jgi:hypothetical protein